MLQLFYFQSVLTDRSAAMAMYASVAMKMMDKDLIESVDMQVKAPFKGKNYIALKRSREDAVASAIRWEMKNGLATAEPIEWCVLTVHYTHAQAFRLFDEGVLELDKACISPGWRMMKPIDLSATSHEWSMKKVGALNLEDFVKVHLADCKPSETTDTCKQCGRSDMIVFSRRKSWYYCPPCWQGYWSSQRASD